MINQASEMALHANTAYPLALSMMTLSDAADFFGSKAFAGYRSTIESRQRLAVATLNRFDGVMKAMGGIGKLLASLGKARRL